MIERDKKGRFVKNHIVPQRWREIISEKQKGRIPWNVNRKMKINCLNCNKEFEIVLSRKNIAKFCSQKCYFKYWKIHPELTKIKSEKISEYMKQQYKEDKRKGFQNNHVSFNAVNIPKEILYKKYIIEKKSGRTIAKELNVSNITIFNKLNLYYIKSRTKSEALKGRHNSLSTQFKKGHKGYKANLGKHHTEESKRKNREKNKGRHHSPKTEFTSERIKKMWQDPKYRENKLEKRLKQVFPVKDTFIEIKLQNKLKDLEIKFIPHYPILGQPDIFIEPNICIFVDGCYWHGCEQCYNRNRMSNWIKARKVADLLIAQKLINDGYVVLRLWEHEINNNIEEVSNSILKVVGTGNVNAKEP